MFIYITWLTVTCGFSVELFNFLFVDVVSMHNLFSSLVVFLFLPNVLTGQFQ